MRFNKTSSTFSQSFFARIRGKFQKQEQKIQIKITEEKITEKTVSESGVKEHYLDVNFILMVIWIVLLNMNVLNCIFTWNSYARFVAGENYKSKIVQKCIFFFEISHHKSTSMILARTPGQLLSSRCSAGWSRMASPNA